MFVQEKNPLEKKRVLLVDDDIVVLNGIRRVLENAGCEVVACGSGHEALGVLARESFDVMISDVEMPGITGVNLLRAVRNYDLDLPIVLITGCPDVQSAADAVAYGAFRYLIKPVPIDSLQSVVTRAATAGRIARSKRECVEEFGSTRFQVGDRASVDVALDRALRTLWTAYQPIVRASDARVFAYEALLRVEEPLLPHPGAVLLAAERAGRIQDVGRAVRASVVTSARAAEASWYLFVNLHPEELLDPALFLKESLFAALAPRVVLEITERASLDHIADVRARVDALRQLGFQVALDDLGAGYAGLTSFALLEPEFVKLDMSLIQDIDRDQTKRKIVRTMVGLCQDMGKKIIAEGVERIEERDVLVDLNCDLLQGYLFSKAGKPFPAVVAHQPLST